MSFSGSLPRQGGRKVVSQMSILGLLQKKPVASPMPIVSSSIEPPTEEYMAIAKRLGVTVNGLTRITTLETVLLDEHVRIYRFKDVISYMDKKTPKGKIWGWTAVRVVDRNRCGRSVTFGYNDVNGRFFPGPYDKPIPFPVLLTMEKIENAMAQLPEASRPAFFITDYAVPSPDPFLMVATPGVSQIQQPSASGHLWQALEESCFIIERWDEPNFR